MNFVDQAFADQMAFNLSADGPFAEQVIITPRGGSARTIWANVDRQPRLQVGSDGMTYRPRALFDVLKDPAKGITMAETATGLTLTYNVRLGDDSSARTLPASLAQVEGNQDAATIRLEI